MSRMGSSSIDRLMWFDTKVDDVIDVVGLIDVIGVQMMIDDVMM